MKRGIGIGCLLVVASSSMAGDVYPLEMDGTWVYSYHNVLAYEGAANAMTNVTEGRMTVRVVGSLTTNDVTYTQTEATYENIFGMTPQTQLLRQDEGGVYIAGVIRDTFYESMLLRMPLELGATWDYYDGEKGQRKIVEIGPMTIGGTTYERCIKVVRVFDSEEKQKIWTNESYYAPGFGEVQFRFIQRLGPTLSDTTITLISYTRP